MILTAFTPTSSLGRHGAGQRRLVRRFLPLILLLVITGCRYNPANFSGNALIGYCQGEPATFGIGYSDGSFLPASPAGGVTYEGTPGRDVVVVMNGPVTFNGQGGDDLICIRKNLDPFGNGTGPVVINGGEGNDEVYVDSDSPLALAFDGGPGDDYAQGGVNDDLLIGGTDTDVLIGADGDDTCKEELASGPDTMCDGSNIILILLDDLDETTTDYWHPMPNAKALLADTGLTFSETFATNPVCCPARATLLTGDMPHNTGVVDGTPPDGAWPAFVNSGAEQDTIGTRLQAAGYRTAYLGKYMNFYNQPRTVPPGWDDWFGFIGGFAYYGGYNYLVSDNGQPSFYGATVHDYQTDVLTEEAIEFIIQSEENDEQPFFLLVSPTAPHIPLPPAMRHLPNPYASDPLPTRPNYDELDVSDKPTWLKDGRPQLSTAEYEAILADHRDRMGTLLAVDDMVVNIVNELVAQDELDETVIIFTSDNGYNLGAHRMNLKQLPYDESARVPMVITGVGVGTGTISDLVNHSDIAPTIMDIAGKQAPDMDGMSLIPLIDGSASSWRSDMLIQFRGTYTPYTFNFDTFAEIQYAINEGATMWAPSYRAVRSAQWLYVEWYEGNPHEYELYDVLADPYQLDNLLVTEPGVHLATAAAMQTRLNALSICSGPTCKD